MSELITLKNGLRIYVDAMPGFETTALGVWARAGSIDERPREHGLAHLLEHMAFKGTTTRNARQIAEEIEAVGGYLNAATSAQRTGYYVRLLKNDITLGLDILSDILINPIFDESEFSKEKEVVIQEMGEAADTPDDVVFENLQSVSWKGHALARPILGTPESVRRHTTVDLRAFMHRGYRPDEMIVAAAGAVDVDDFARQAEEAFANLQFSSDGNARSAPVFNGGSRHDNRDIEQTHIAVAFPGVSSKSPDFFAARIFADALGGGMSSRLFQKVREEQGLAYSVYAFSDSYDDCGLIGAYAGADAMEVPAIAKAFREEITAMAAGAEQPEIDRARALLRASLLMGLENPATRIEGAAGQLFRDGVVLTVEEINDHLDAVSVEDVKRCAEAALAGPVAISLVGAADVDAIQTALAN